MSALTRLFPIYTVEADWSGRFCIARPTLWRNYGYQLMAAETSVPSAPYRFDMPLSFVSRRPCVWYAGHGRCEATSDRLIASAERPATIIPLTIGLSVTGKNRFRQTGYRFWKINGFNIPTLKQYISHRFWNKKKVKIQQKIQSQYE